MITIRLIGGLGNQMFQYAAALGLARRHGTDVQIDATAFETYDLWPYQLAALNVPQNMAVTRLRAGRMARLLRRLKGPRREYRNLTFAYDEAFEHLPDSVALNGGLQSWRYFSNVEDEVRQVFSPKEPLGVVAQAYAERIATSALSVSLHVRRGDYLAIQSAGIHVALGPTYYRRAIGVMRALVGREARFFLFSDDPEWVRQNLQDLTDFDVVEGQADRPWEDMVLMSHCDHHIIGNSSFSWWGAWLNPSPTKQVIAPREWFAPQTLRKNNVCDLLPDGWIAL